MLCYQNLTYNGHWNYRKVWSRYWSELEPWIASPKSWPRDHAKLHSDETHSLASATVYQTITNPTNKLLLIAKVKNKRILLILYCTIWQSVQTDLTSKRHWLLKKGKISVKYTVAQSWKKLFQFAFSCNQDWLPFLYFILRYHRRI